MVKTINIKDLKKYDQKLFLNFLRVHYLYRHLEEIRLKFRKELGEVLINYNFRDTIKIIDNENKIITLCNYRESEYISPNGDVFKDIVDIRPRPFIEVKTDKTRLCFPQQINPLEIMKIISLNNIIKVRK